MGGARAVASVTDDRVDDRADDGATTPDEPAGAAGPALSRARAERIARAQACVRCREYSYKRVRVAPAAPAIRDALRVTWTATLVCGVCGTVQELGIGDDEDVVYVG